MNSSLILLRFMFLPIFCYYYCFLIIFYEELINKLYILSRFNLSGITLSFTTVVIFALQIYKQYLICIYMEVHALSMTNATCLVPFIHSYSCCSLWSIENSSFPISFLIFRQSLGLLGRGSAHCKVATCRRQHKHRINVDKHPCLE
jgi:hypothetical protein